MVKIKFLGDEIPNENMHYACLTCINYWFCYENGKKELSTSYLEECKYKIKRIKMLKFITTKLESESESELESDSE